MIYQNGRLTIVGSHGRSYLFRRAMTLAIFSFLFFSARQLLTAQEKPDFNGASESVASFAPFSLSLNGTDSSLTVPNSLSLNFNGAMTIETWIKSADYALPQTVLLRPGSYGLRVGGNSAIFTICPAFGRCFNASTAATLEPNQWQHIAAVYDGNQMRVYINGQRSSSGRYINDVGSPSAVSGVLKIGASDDGTQKFRGLLDEVRLSNSALYSANFFPTAQLESNVNSVGLWRFDGGTFNDSTTNNNHATSSGGSSFSLDVPPVAVNGFVITPTPNVGPSNNLYGVKTISPTEVWAVGDHGPAGFCCFPKTPVSLRWNGSQWINVPVPMPPGTIDGKLIAVDATSSTNVWAIGTVGSNNSAKVWFLRWNGSEWNTVALVSDPLYPQFGIGIINSITVISETDVWAVGARIGGQSWTLHWDGTSVQTVPSPNLDMGGNGLHDVDAINANDVWAVGSFMVIRWNGMAWLPVPNAPRNAHFSSVAAIAPNDVWATATFTSCGPFQGCSSSDGLYHFDGSQWTIVPVPGVIGQLFLEDVTATASNNVWVVGSSSGKTYVAHFNGTNWQRVASENTPPASSDLDKLLSVSALNSTDVFTVGFAIDIFYDPQHREVRNTLALRRSVIP